uniref:Uncharacterized protein n=1 Tax=Salmonella phage PMBT31 TaxID=3153514 RepID=A0AAU8GK43_9CAUD
MVLEYVLSHENQNDSTKSHAPRGANSHEMGDHLLLKHTNIFKGNICVQDDTPVAAHLLGWHNTFF